MTAYAIYRLPHEDHATLIRQSEGEPAEYLSCAELNGRKGFVLTPFEVTAQQPILVIRPDEVERVELVESGKRKVERGKRKEESGKRKEESRKWKEERDYQLGNNLQQNYSPSSFHFPLSSKKNYAIDFANFHAQLVSGAFRKIVLARCADEETPEAISPMQLFHRACMLYPRMFIALVSTAKSGCWLTATPEILLDGKAETWRTIALAGTMKLEGEHLAGEGEKVTWSTKNIQEQRIVATYITECLERFTGEFHEEGPRTVRAANLVHLRSDFTFSLPDNQHLGDLLHVLHPTPAVCGLPKRETFEFITHNEYTPRRYYSGFMGVLDPTAETHLYVSLRCMNIEGQRYHLYAGGGLLKDSQEELEWQETEAKLETMRGLLDIRT